MYKRTIAVIFAGFLTVFIAYSIRYGYGILLPEMLPSLQISKTQAGVIYSSYFITYTILAPVLGMMSDRLDIRKILTVFVLILGVGTFLMAFSSSLLTASLFFAIAGIGMTACWTPLIPLVQRWVRDNRRGAALTIMDLGSTLSIIASSFVLPLAVRAFDWRAAWMFLGTAALLMAAVDYILVRNKPGTTNPVKDRDSAPTAPFKLDYGRLLREERFWLIGISYLFVGFTVIIIFTFLPTYGVQSLGMPYGMAASLVAIIAAAGIAGKLILGPLSDTWGRVKVMMVCCAFMAAGALGMSFCRNFLSLSIFCGVFGIGYGAVWPVYAAVTGDYFPKDAIGRVMGLWTVLLGVGSIAGPVISGWTIDFSGRFLLAFVMAGAATVISLMILIPLLGKRNAAGK